MSNYHHQQSTPGPENSGQGQLVSDQQQQQEEQQQLYQEHLPPPLTADDNLDATSDYSSNSSSGFTSIDQSRTHVYEHGRRYQCFLEGRYPLPNDELEQDREEIKHHLVKNILGGRLYLSPIGDHPHKIADMGCGTGLWTVEIGDKFPGARVIGVDASNIQPRWVPPNVEFRMDDIEGEWTELYADLDLVFLRSVIGVVGKQENIIASAFKNLKPGGWVEFQDFTLPRPDEDGNPSPGHPWRTVTDIMTHTYNSIWGWKIDYSYRLPDVLRDAGFVNTHVRRDEIPIGNWAPDETLREWGIMNQNLMQDLANGVLSRYDDLGLTKEDADSLLKELSIAFTECRDRPTTWWTIIFAQKPPR